MNKIKRLAASYAAYIAIPWRTDAAASQRVIFCIYDEADELRLRAAIGEFELSTRQAGHEWALFDLTDSFAEWMSVQKYAESYFQKPRLLSSLMRRYRDDIIDRFDRFMADAQPGADAVVAVTGAGSLFGFLKVKEAVERMAPRVAGRLLVFFPGSYENNNYRLLDGYDGWNYLAVPITADREF